MPIGSFTYEPTANPLKRIFRKVFGTPDLHSHFRLRPMLKYFESHSPCPASEMRILELGCGCGLNLFELARRFPRLRGVGCDLNSRAIAYARSTASRLFPDRLRFSEVDICRHDMEGEFDVVLLIDVLEHVTNPEELLLRASGLLKPGGEVLVSVPTPRIPKFSAVTSTTPSATWSKDTI